MAEQAKEIRGTVIRLFHQSPRFCAGRLLPVREDVTRGGEITFAGAAFVTEGEAVTLRGKWVDDAKWGRQFKVEARVHGGEMDVKGLAAWLAVHGEAGGIGPVKAEKIAREFGENFGGVLRDDPEQVAIFAKVPLGTVQRLAASWAEREELNAVATKLAAWELTEHQIHALYEKFKGSIVPLLRQDPYLLVGEVSGLGFRKVDEIARKLGTPETHPGRLAAALLHALHEIAREGSTCIDRASLLDAAVELLELRRDDAGALLSVRLDELAGERRRLLEVAAGGRRFYATPAAWRHESGVAAFLKAAAGPNPHWPEGAAGPRGAEWLVGHHCPHLDDSQRRAVAMALRHRACLITGGAGSGKTTIVKAITDLYRSDDLEVALCAPTGKAARRLEEVVKGCEAGTIHRLLEYHPAEGFQRNRDNPLDADALVVDEASMIDAALAWHLFSAVGPKTALVLVGDSQQLPPVGPGALLRDCVAHELLPLTVLGHCHRQAGALKKNCSAVLLGEVHPTEMNVPEGEPGPWYVLRRLATPADVLAMAEKLWCEVLPKRLGYDVARDVQFLTPTHSGPLGTRALNVLLQKLYQRSLGVGVAPVVGEGRPPLYVGDKVIQTRNNYNLGVMNGHQGFVLQVRPLVADFDGKVVAVPDDCRGDVELAYALTPWKCQGSEFPCVVTVCHKSHSFQLHRSLLYTAVTRARRTSILLGDEGGVRHAAATQRDDRRRTMLGLIAGGAHVAAG